MNQSVLSTSGVAFSSGADCQLTSIMGEEGEAVLRGITAAMIGSHDPVTLDSAMTQIRAFDRCNKFRMASSTAPVPRSGPDGMEGGRRRVSYGVYLGKGAILTCILGAGPDKDSQALRDAASNCNVRLVHIFTFSRPGIRVSELHGKSGKSQHVQWYGVQRPTDVILKLAPRVLGPIPPDIADSLVPTSTSGCDDQAESVSHAFAAWLTGQPLPQQAEVLGTGTETVVAADGGTGGRCTGKKITWPSSAPGLKWNRLLGSKTARGGGGAAAAPPEAPGDDSNAAIKAGAAPAVAAHKRAVTLEAAWSEFERRVLERPVAEYATDLERAWLAELKMMPMEDVVAETAGGA